MTLTTSPSPAVVRFAEYWHRKTGQEISMETAMLYLDRLCDYFRLLHEMDLEIKARAAKKESLEV